MDPRIFGYYERELQYLQEVGAEFARAHPTTAAELELGGGKPADPYVERLLEGAAFLAARVQLKIDARVPDFTEHLLSLVLPPAVAPTPSCAIIEFRPQFAEPALRSGVRIPRNTPLRTPLEKGGRSACEFRTAHDVTLWPFKITDVVHHSGTGVLAARKLNVGSEVRGAIVLRLETAGAFPFSSLPIESLDLYLAGGANVGAKLYSLVAAHGLRAVVIGGSSAAPISVQPIGFEDGEAMLPLPPTGFRGFRALHEFMTLRERVAFVRLTGLRQALAESKSDKLEIALLLDDVDPSLDGALSPEHVRLGCTPAANVFPKTLDRTSVDGRDVQQHLVPDRSHPLDYEIYGVSRVAAIGSRASDSVEVLPFYFHRHVDRAARETSYFTINRRPRISPAPNNPKPARSTYVGSETYIAIVDSSGQSVGSEQRQLEIEAFCTNRDLPILTAFGRGSSDFVRDGVPAVESIRCITGPTQPRSSPAFGETAWYFISLLAANHLGLSADGVARDAQALRTTISLFADRSDRTIARRIDGIREVTCKPVIRRIPGAGPVCFARGLAISIQVDEDAFEGDALMLGAALDEYLARSVTLNSFSELSLFGLRNLRDPIKRWKPRSGSRRGL